MNYVVVVTINTTDLRYLATVETLKDVDDVIKLWADTYSKHTFYVYRQIGKATTESMIHINLTIEDDNDKKALV